MTMRLVLLLALALAPAASAQAEACEESDPCVWFLDVDDVGLATGDGASRINATQGDWFTINATNFDVEDHTLNFQGHGVSLALEPAQEAETAAFQLATAGTFLLQDERGNSVSVVVNPGDVNDQEAGLIDESGNPASTTDADDGTTGKGAPGFSLLVLTAALVALSLLRRR